MIFRGVANQGTTEGKTVERN